jgi:hypothetical protein
VTINSYLIQLANEAILRDSEKPSIERSLSALKTRLSTYFASDIKKQFVFGSYNRGTILPRAMDLLSDVDYMIIFSDIQYQPQTYLNKLRAFAEYYYSSSEITQSNPTIVLTMNHIRFELVPAVESYLGGLQIPGKVNNYQNWIQTDPTGFNQILAATNQSNQSLIKPLIRLVKYWNARSKYPFESFDLEQRIVQHKFSLMGLFGNPQLKNYFFSFMDGLEFGYLASQWKQDALNKAKNIINEAKEFDRDGYPVTAEETIAQFLPRISGYTS